MKAETYSATLRHDNGRVRLKVVSLSGEKGAIAQVTAAEGCPASAISLRKVKAKKTRL